jgi:hypothetical protein
MNQVIDLAARVLAGASPLLLVGGLLALAAWRDRRALAVIARQTRLSDALAEEAGALVAPVVTRRGGAWRVRVAVPLGRPAVVAHVVGVLHRTLARLGDDPYEIVLTPREPAPRAIARRRRPDGPRLRAA